MNDLADTVQRFCFRWFLNDPHPALLVLAGKPGCAKTHCAEAIYRYACALASKSWEDRHWPGHSLPRAGFYSWPECCSFFADRKFDFFGDLMAADLLIVDDLGAENDPWKIGVDRICQVLSARENRFTVVTTNNSPAEWASRFDPRVNDRLMRNSEIVDLSAVPSYCTVAAFRGEPVQVEQPGKSRHLSEILTVAVNQTKP